MGFYFVKIKRGERGICSFFFPPQSQQTGREGERPRGGREGRRGCCHQHCGPVLCCGCGCEAAAAAAAFSMEDAHSRWCWFCYSVSIATVCLLSVCACVWTYCTCELSAWQSSPLYRDQPFSIFFLLHLLMQSHFPCSRLSVPGRNKDVSFIYFFLSCKQAHVTHCEFASLPNLCSGERAVIRFESALGKKRQRGGGVSLSWCNRPPPSPHPPHSLQHPPHSSSLNRRIIQRGRWPFNLKICLFFLISPLFLPPLPPHHSCLYPPPSHHSLMTPETSV